MEQTIEEAFRVSGLRTDDIRPSVEVLGLMLLRLQISDFCQLLIFLKTEAN
jgi:hypothetical protein